MSKHFSHVKHCAVLAAIGLFLLIPFRTLAEPIPSRTEETVAVSVTAAPKSGDESSRVSVVVVAVLVSTWTNRLATPE